MPYRPGTVASFTSSLAQHIEDAFAAEMMMEKGEPLPQVAVAERRMLFTAIAQGVLGFLAKHDVNFQVSLVSGTVATLDLRAPYLTVSWNGTTRIVTATGTHFPAGRVTLYWASDGSTAGSADHAGTGTLTITASAGSRTGRQVLVARDTAGNAATAEVTV